MSGFRRFLAVPGAHFQKTTESSLARKGIFVSRYLRWLKTVSSTFQDVEFTKILYMGFRATLNFRKFKVALNPMYRILLNFAKSYILSCLSKFYNKKEFHRAVFEI